MTRDTALNSDCAYVGNAVWKMTDVAALGMSAGEKTREHEAQVESELEALMTRFPELKLRLSGKYVRLGEREEPMIQVSEIAAEPSLEMLFAGLDTLKDALEVTEGFRGLRFLGTENAVTVDGSICALIDGLPSRTNAHFVLRDSGFQYDVHIRGRSYRKADTELDDELVISLDDTAENIRELLIRTAWRVGDFKRGTGDPKLSPDLQRVLRTELALKEDRVAKLVKAARNALIFRNLPYDPDYAAITAALWRGGDFLVVTDTSGKDELQKIWKEVIDCVAFEFYRRQRILFTVRTHSHRKAGGSSASQVSSPAPLEAVTFRPIPNEALQYLRLAEMSNVVTFRYLSFYHVLEHFFSEVAYEALYSEVMKILSSPDIESRMNRYARAVTDLVEDFAINVREDEPRLKLTLRKFVPFPTVKSDLPEPILKALQKSVTFSRGLRLGPVDTNNEDRFFGDLANRIYSMRNAIVHSKRAEVKSKGTFDLDGEDSGKIAGECEMVRHFALEVVSRAAVID